jgi:beta-xylosidase
VALAVGAILFVGLAVTGLLLVWSSSVAGPCDGVTFGRPGSGAASEPPVGGQPPVAERIRRAFRLAHNNVVYCHDFADPSVLRVGDAYYAYATNTADRHVPVLYGAGFLDSQHVTDALPRLPAWSSPGRVWAPSVIADSHGYTLFYSTADRATGRQCLSIAHAREPTGPFVDNSRRPWRCDAYDAQPFIDADHNAYLLWAQQGGIRASRLSADHRHFVGRSVEILRADHAWEGGVVEAPELVRHGTDLWLFFSGNRWDRRAYAIGVARCSSPLGSCAASPRPWLASQATVLGPGGEDVFADDHGRSWMAFHGWIDHVGYPDGARSLFIVPITLTGARPVVE